MRKTLIILMVSFCVMFVAQAQTGKKKRKVYRTQTGAIIEAPKPLFERRNKRAKPELQKVQSKAQKERVDLEYKSRLELLEEKLMELEEHTADYQPDTIFVYTTLYDTTTVFDTTFIYTNATTTNYDTLIISDSLFITNYDTTTLIKTNFDTLVIRDTTYLHTYDTTVIRDTLWAFATDTVIVYDTSWVFAYDTTFIKDSLWVFAHDSTIVYDTLVVFNNDTVTIHTHSSNFTPDMTDGQRSQFPKWKTLNDAIHARDTGDPTAQEWINQALYEADGNWDLAGEEYLKFQNIYSSAVVKSILNRPKNPNFVGPELKYKSVIFDTLKILSFDTLMIKDTVRDLVKQTHILYDTSVISNQKNVIAELTPPDHELILKFHQNGNVREKGLMKNGKRNGDWTFFDESGNEIRTIKYVMGKIEKDQDMNNQQISDRSAGGLDKNNSDETKLINKSSTAKKPKENILTKLKRYSPIYKIKSEHVTEN